MRQADIGGDTRAAESRRAGRTAIAMAAAVACVAAGGSAAFAQLRAFPGADGAAANVTGGRGGSVYHVTLNDQSFSDNRPGTLRYGLNSANFPAGPRTIVFDVSGVFSLDRAPTTGYTPDGNGWDTQSRLNIPSDVTIAGQTAPGPVYVMGGVIKPGGNNIILRNISVAAGYGRRNFSGPGVTPVAGDFPDSYVYDAIDVSGTNVMIDHVTTVYGTDETISCNELANNLTVQYSTIAQGQNYPQADAENPGTYTGHALGSLLQGGSNAQISFHHNLYAHLKGRLPRVGTESTKLTVAGVGAYNDFRNNVFYNWLGTAGTGASGQPSQNNFVGNFYLAGPGGENPVGGTSTAITTAGGGTSIFSTSANVYHTGNLKDTNKDGDALDGVALTNSDFSGTTIRTTPYTVTPYYGTSDSATAAYNQVLNYAGANWSNRAAIDQRLINETRTGTGQIKAWADDPFNSSATEGTEWRAIFNTPGVARPADFDTDQDGMPDAWELRHGLDPAVANNNADFDSDGYTDLEEYLNDLAAWPASTAITWAGGTARYAIQGNWNLNWQPSRYDTVLVNAGVATVDAVGQHAGTLNVGTTAGANGRVDVSGGWLDVATALNVGGSGTGRVQHTGGQVLAPTITVASGGTYNLAGGELFVGTLNRTGTGAFNLTAGLLHAGAVNFNLLNQGGTIAPGSFASRVGRTQVNGTLTVNAGTLQIELAGRARGTEYDAVDASGAVALGGNLQIALAGFVPSRTDVFTILTGASVVGAFANANPWGLFTVDGGVAAMRLSNTGTALLLDRFTIRGDANLDGLVNNLDIAPFVALLTGNSGVSGELGFAADINADGAVNNLDIAPFVALLTGTGSASAGDPRWGALVPEPSALSLVIGGGSLLRRRRSRQPQREA